MFFCKKHINCVAVLFLFYNIFFLNAFAQPQNNSESEKSGFKIITKEERQKSHEMMIQWLEQIRQSTEKEHSYIGKSFYKQTQEKLKRAAKMPLGAKAKWSLYHEAGFVELYYGTLEKALFYFNKAYEIAPNAQLDNITELVQTHFYRGLVYLRIAETENCCLKNHPQSCIVPIQPAAFHTEKEGSLKAIQNFEEILKLMSNYSKNESMDAFEDGIKWLLNIAYMTLGDYPQNVPEKYLIPHSVFTSKIDFPRFNNVAPQLHLDRFNLSGSVIIDDFNNDHYLDIVTSSWDTDGQLRFFRNEGNGTFSDQTESAGLLGLYGGLNMLQTDYNNDGHLDIFVLRGAWLKEKGQHPNSLLQNNGDGTFSDVTFKTGLGRIHYPTQTGAWADYDNDGDLDLYIGNEYSPEIEAYNQLFRNDQGFFTDVAQESGVLNKAFAKSVVWGDFDGDRFMDLYVSNMGYPNRLYRNNQDGTFTNVAPQLNVTEPQYSFPCWFWDFDNDGHLDIFVASYSGDFKEFGRICFGKPTIFEKSCLYKNDGQGVFLNVTKEQNLEMMALAMGSNFGDLNNDGFLDFYLGTGNPQFENLIPNYMLLNQNGKHFVDVSMAGGFAHLQKGHGVAFGDIDHDGDMDIFEQMGGAYRGDEYGDVLYENPGFSNHWITIKLIGTRSNRAAIGARIHAKIMEEGRMRSIYRHINSGGSFGANPLQQTIGLSQAQQIEVLEIFWPTTGETQTFLNVPINQHIQIIEGESDYSKIVLKTLKFGSTENK